MGKGRIRRRGGRVNRRTLAGLLTAGALVILGLVGYMSGGGIANAYYYYYYTAPVPANLTLTGNATNPVGTSHTVTATVTDASNTAVSGIVVRFTVTGSVSTSGSCTTDTQGQCTFTYTGPSLPGADVISAFADTNNDTNPSSDEPTATAMKVWVLPASTPGHVTGGGQILKGSGNTVAFGFDVNHTTKNVKGECNVINLTPRRMIRCTDVSTLVVSGNTATFYGHAVDNGVGTTFVIKVVDNGEPGTADTFSITTASGYSVSGTLSGGNIQVH